MSWKQERENLQAALSIENCPIKIGDEVELLSELVHGNIITEHGSKGTIVVIEIDPTYPNYFFTIQHPDGFTHHTVDRLIKGEHPVPPPSYCPYEIGQETRLGTVIGVERTRNDWKLKIRTPNDRESWFSQSWLTSDALSPGFDQR